MDKSYVLGDVVQAWVETVLPGQPVMAERAVALAVSSYEAGDPIGAVCEQVSEVVECWMHHPATQESGSHALVRLAS